MTLKELRVNLGWTISKLADESGIERHTISRAESGYSVNAATAKSLADALSRGYHRTIKPTDIEGLRIQ